MMRFSEKCLKIAKTCNLCLICMTTGMYISVMGPCLLDLTDQVNTDMQHIGIIYTARSIAYIVSSVFAGMIMDATKYKQGVMTVCNITVSGALLAIPWCQSLGILIACTVVASISNSFLTIGAAVLCLKLWGTKNGPYIHALHFVGGLGCLLAPLIAAPFLGVPTSDTISDYINNATHATNFSSSYNYTPAIPEANNFTSMHNTSRIVYPFSIIGLYSLLVSVMSFLICITSPTETEDQSVKNEQNSQHEKRFIVTIIALGGSFLFVTSNVEYGYAQMLTTYVVKGYLQLSASDGSYMTSIFWIAFSVSRLAVVFIAIKLSHFTIIIASLIVSSAGVFILILLAHSEWAIWVSSILLGAGMGPLFAATLGWLGVYITITNKIAAVLAMAMAIGTMVIPFTIGYFIEAYPDVFVYFIFVGYILSCLTFIFLFLILRKREVRCDRSNKEPA